MHGAEEDRGARRKRWWYLLLLVPYVALLWVPFYAGAQPEILGVPYFYWYQFLWVFIAAILTAVVYFATRDEDRA
jgi:uncharacterized protein DUF3311